MWLCWPCRCVPFIRKSQCPLCQLRGEYSLLLKCLAPQGKSGTNSYAALLDLYISVLCISGHIAVKYLHYSRHRRGEFAKCPQSKNNKEQSISLSLPFYEMTWGRRWFYCRNVESPELSASFSESFNVAAFMKCILILHHKRSTDFLRISKPVTHCSAYKSFTAGGLLKVTTIHNSSLQNLNNFSTCSLL